jgi:MerR family transcriptional regulator, copper efflux regulator
MSSSHRHLTLLPGERFPAETPAEATSRPGDVGEEELLQVGDLARAVGKTVRAIHLYEEMGLLKAHERSKGRYRLFTQDAVVRVRWIGKLQSLGLSLSEIQAIERARSDVSSAQSAAARLREVYDQDQDRRAARSGNRARGKFGLPGWLQHRLRVRSQGRVLSRLRSAPRTPT